MATTQSTESATKVLVDGIGQEIHVGDYVVYYVTRGASVIRRSFGRVIGFTASGIRLKTPAFYYHHEEPLRTTVLYYSERCIVIPDLSIVPPNIFDQYLRPLVEDARNNPL